MVSKEEVSCPHSNNYDMVNYHEFMKFNDFEINYCLYSMFQDKCFVEK
jgi:hypothetical protein